MTPEAKAAQRTAALERANHRRCEIARRRRELARMEPDAAMSVVANVLRDPDETIGSMRIGGLLSAIPRVGEKRVRRLLRAAGVSTADRHVEDLSPRQRHQLATMLTDQSQRPRPRSARPVLEQAT